MLCLLNCKSTKKMPYCRGCGRC